MVPTGICRLGRRGAARAAAGAAALTALLACPGGERRGYAPAGEAAPENELSRRVRSLYTAPDLVATGAWSWDAPRGETFVLVEVQSTIPGLVQVRADLWLVDDTLFLPVGRSDVLLVAAEIGAFTFEDLTGDGLPDLLGYVADSAGSRYPLFIPGARGAMADELEFAAPQWRFSAEPDSAPGAVGGPGRACYLRLWALEPSPDGGGEGWRYLAILPEGRLGSPAAAPPPCR